MVSTATKNSDDTKDRPGGNKMADSDKNQTVLIDISQSEYTK
jgi:hypothetical protein